MSLKRKAKSIILILFYLIRHPRKFYNALSARGKKWAFRGLIFLLIILIAVPASFWYQARHAKAAWWDDSWAYRQRVQLTNSTGAALTDFQTAIVVDTASLITAGKMIATTCADLRFTDSTGKILPYWIEENNPGCNSATTKVWLKVPSVYAGTNATNIYMYYGNPSASATQSGDKTFEFFDDFNDNQINTTKWNITGNTWSETSGQLEVLNSGTAGVSYSLATTKTYTVADAVLETRMTPYAVGSSQGKGVAFRYTDANNLYIATCEAWTTARIDIGERVSGGWTNLSQVDMTGGVSVGVPYKQVISFSGTSFSNTTTNLSTSQSTQTTTTDSSHAGAKAVGLIVDRDETSTGAKYDYFFARKYASADPTTSASAEEIGPGPIAYWKFDEGQGNTAYNSTISRGGLADIFTDGTNFANTGWWSADGGGTITFPSGTNGFSGTYIQYVCSGGGADRFWAPNGGDSKSFSPSGDSYKVDFDYEASKTFNVQVRDSTILGGSSIPANTGTPKHFSLTFKISDVVWNGGYRSKEDILFYLGSATGTDYLRVDNLTIMPMTTNAAAAINNATWKPESECVSGKCLGFDGTDDFVRMGASNLIGTGTNPFTFSTWIRPTKTLANGEYYFPVRLKQDSQFFFSFYKTGGVFYAIPVFRGATQFGTPVDETTIVNKWSHLTVVYNGGNKSSASSYVTYINGVQIAAGSTSFGGAGGTCNDNAIGSDADGSCVSNIGLFKGQIDEVKTYRYVRTSAQILQDYNSGLSGQSAASGSSQALGSKSPKWMTDGLVGQWKMDEASWAGTSGEVLDASGNANNGTAVGGATTAAGKFGNGGAFDGTGDYAELGTTNIPTGASPRTLSIWAKPAASNSGYRAILNEGTYASNQQFQIGISGGYFNINWYSASLADPTAYTADTWYHIVAVYDGSTLTLYKNGVLVATQTGLTLGTVMSKVRIAANPNGSENFNGVADDARIYNRALTADEVKQMSEWAPGPVAYWNFDEKTGGTANDSSGNGKNGTVTNATWANGKYGSALSFDGNSDYVNAGDDGVFDFGTKSFTISSWIYHTADNTAYDFVMGKSGFWGTPEYELYFSNAALSFKIDDGAGHSSSISGGNLSVNRWYYVTGTYDGSNIKIFIDGQQANSSSLSGATLSSGYSFMVGFNTSESFTGKIDEPRVYNYARTQKQILQDMEGVVAAATNTSSGPLPDPVGYWKMEEGQGITAYDSSTNGNNGTLTNMSLPATATSGWNNSGKFGKALGFDGSNDYITMGSSVPSALQIQNEITLDAWIYATQYPDNNLGLIVGSQNDTNHAGATIFLDGRTNPDGQTAPAGHIHFQIGDGSNWHTSNANAQVPLNQWVHITATRKANEDAKIYYNGVSQPVTSIAWTGTLAYTNAVFQIGRQSDSGGTNYRYFNGLIDEVKAYNVALSSDQVNQDMNQGKSLVMGSAGMSSAGVPSNAASQEYCVPGDATSCAGPVGEWKMEEKTGTAAKDTSGNGFDGSVTSATWTAGKVGSALNFSGSSQYVTVADNSTLKPTSAITLEAWFNTNDKTAQGKILSKTESSGYQIGLNPDGYTGYLCFLVNIGGTYYYGTYPTSSLSNGVWYHAVGTFDGSTVKLYLNGSLVSSTNQSGSITQGAYPLCIGSEPGSTCANGGGYNFNGKLDQVRIFNYARSAAQVAWDYNRGGPVGWWKLDEAEGDQAHDWSGNSNTGTLTSMDPPSDWVSGKFGNALDFDGSNDRVVIPDSDLWAFGSNNFSVGFWVKYNSVTGTKSMMGNDEGGGNVEKWSVMLNYPSSNLFTFHFNGAVIGPQDVSFSWTPSTGTWYHVVIARSGNSWNMYANGTQTGGTQTNSNAVQNASASLTLGTEGESYAWLNGLLDDVRVYNYALTTEQVKQIMNNGSALRFGE